MQKVLTPVVLGRDGSRVAGPRGSECQFRSVLEVIAVLSVEAFRLFRVFGVFRVGKVFRFLGDLGSSGPSGLLLSSKWKKSIAGRVVGN